MDSLSLSGTCPHSFCHCMSMALWSRVSRRKTTKWNWIWFLFGFALQTAVPLTENFAGEANISRARLSSWTICRTRRYPWRTYILRHHINLSSFLDKSNILIDGDGCPRICDYGLAFVIEPSEFTSIKTAGACRWTAPEIMNPPEDDEYLNDSFDLFTKESDVYAFGMTFHEVILDYMMSWRRFTDRRWHMQIFTGKYPFHHKKYDSSVIFSVLNGDRPGLPPFLNEREDLRELIHGCWHREASSRPTSRVVNRRLNVDTPAVCATVPPIVWC